MAELTTRRTKRQREKMLKDQLKQKRGSRLMFGALAFGVAGILTLGGGSAAFALDGTDPVDETSSTQVITDDTASAATEEGTTEKTSDDTQSVDDTTTEKAPADTEETTSTDSENAPALTEGSATGEDPKSTNSTTKTTESTPDVEDIGTASQPEPNTSTDTSNTTTEQTSKTTPFDWNWTYNPPTCNGLTVTYPSNVPAGSNNMDVNIRIKNLVTDEVQTFNFHDSDFITSGKTVTYDWTTHISWKGWTYYEVQWTQVHGTNYHWEGSIICGEETPEVPEPPVAPEPKVEYGAWTDSEWVCGDTEVTQTRTKTTTPYKVVQTSDTTWDIVLDTEHATVTTETSTRALTGEEIKSCEPEEPDLGSMDVTCNGVTVTYPETLPENADYTDVTIYVTNLNGDEKDWGFNWATFDSNPQGTTVFYNLLNDHWVGWTHYEVTKVIAAHVGTWTGSIICGKETPEVPEPPVAPEPKVVYGDWVDGTFGCGATDVTQTRTVTTTPYKVVETETGYEIVLDTEHATVTTETRTRTLNEDEKITCPVDTPPSDDTPSTPVDSTPVLNPSGPLEGGYFNTGDTVLKSGNLSEKGLTIVMVGGSVMLLAAGALAAIALRRRWGHSKA